MRYELSDCEWGVIKPMLPNKPRGIPRVDDRRVLNGIFWVLRSGAPWRDGRSDLYDLDRRPSPAPPELPGPPRGQGGTGRQAGVAEPQRKLTMDDITRSCHRLILQALMPPIERWA
jgi:hypothetical protein